MDRATARRLMERLNDDALRIARRFGLRYRSITAERANVTSRYGVCYSDGAIKIRLRHAVTGRPLKYSSLVNTLCHELAHLRHFNHGPRFKAFYFEILEFARREGIYRPGPAGRGDPVAASARRAAAAVGPTEPARAARSAARPGTPATRPKDPPGPEQLTLFG